INDQTAQREPQALLEIGRLAESGKAHIGRHPIRSRHACPAFPLPNCWSRQSAGQPALLALGLSLPSGFGFCGRSSSFPPAFSTTSAALLEARVTVIVIADLSAPCPRRLIPPHGFESTPAATRAAASTGSLSDSLPASM